MADAISLAPAGRRARRRAFDASAWVGQGATHLAAAWTLEVDRRRLFLWLPVLYVTGIVAYFSAEHEPSLWASGIPLALAVLVAIAGRARLVVLVAALAVAAFFAGFLAGTIRTMRVAGPVLTFPITTTLTGIAESIERTNSGGRIVIAVTGYDPPSAAAPTRVRLTFRGANALVSGDTIRLKARLSPPTPPAVPGGFDFQREAYFQRLGAVGLVSGGIEILPDTTTRPWMVQLNATIDAARNTLTERIVSVIGGSTGAIAAALVTGKRGQIAEADNDAWRGAGIYHIISISGLHMALAAGLFFWTARFVLTLLPAFPFRHHAKKWAAIIAMSGAIAYDIFSGHDVATERALIMTLVMLGAILVDRPALAMRNLAISGLIVTTLRPETVLGPSFQMSFGAVAGLVAYGEFMRQRRERNVVAHAARSDRPASRALQIAIDFTATSLIAGLATAPFQAFHFHRLNPYGLIGNAIAVPLCSIIVMPAALAGVVLYPLGLDAPAWTIMGYGIAAISASAEQVAGIAGAVATVVRFPASALCLLTLAIALLTLMTTGPFRASAVVLGCVGALIIARTPRPDLILSADGRHALVQTDSGLTLLGKGRPVFALQQWLPGENDARAPRDPSLTHAAHCDALGCTAQTRDGQPIALVIDPAAFRDDCERARIIITALRAPRHCASTAVVHDRSHFASYGATYLFRAPGTPAGFAAETARNPRQQRPWLPLPPETRDRAPAADASPGNPTAGNTSVRPPPASAAPAWDPQAPDLPDDPQ